MLISPSKAEDMRWRLKLLGDMENDVREGRVVTAKVIGEMTAYLATRIKSHDYTKEDKFLQKLSTPHG